MYRDELAAAHAQNQVLRRRVAKLEAATVTVDPEPTPEAAKQVPTLRMTHQPASLELRDLAARGNAARRRRQNRNARKQSRAARKAARKQQRNAVAERRSHEKLVAAACQRVVVRKSWWWPMTLVLSLSGTIPMAFASSAWATVYISLAIAAATWPAVTLGIDRWVNGDSLAKERAWLDARPFQMSGHFETLKGRGWIRPVASAVMLESVPTAGFVDDVIAGLAESRSRSTRKLLAMTEVRVVGNVLQFQPAGQDVLGHRAYRHWLHAVTDVLERLAPHYPVESVDVETT